MDNAERRRYQRVPVHYDVLCSPIENSSIKKLNAFAENASRTGLKLRFSGILRKNELVKLEILKTISSKPIKAFGKVVWQKESPLVYGEKIAGIVITKIGWTETDKLITSLDF